MLPVLEAEESLRDAERMAVGAGALKREASREIVRRWQRAAQAGRLVKATTFEPGSLPGIGVRKVAKKKRPETHG